MKKNIYASLYRNVFYLFLCTAISFSVAAQKRLIGATSYGGNQFGTIFSIEAGGSSFLTQKNLEGNPGFNPQDEMIEASNGKLYGTTSLGGNYGDGVLFEYDYVTGTYSKKVDFDGQNGVNPDAAMIKATNGKLYGITTYGGPDGCGVLYEYDVTTGVLTTKINFSELDNRGAFPAGSLVEASNGKLYGQAFTPDADAGIIYEYDPATDIYQRKFDLPSGTYFGSNAMTEAPDGNLYGITSYYGLNNAGFIFKYNFTANAFSVLFDMAASTGSICLGALTLAGNGKFYGVTNGGGANNAGVIFEYDYLTNNYAAKIDMTVAEGSEAWGSLTEFTNGKLYGHTRSGGTSNNGVIFEYDYNSNSYAKKIDLEFINGASPQGSITVVANGKSYGITTLGGLEAGVIFEFDQPSNIYTKKIDFGTSLDGARPEGALTMGNNSKLYGFTFQGGVVNLGVIYEYDYISNSYTKKIDLQSINGNLPNGEMINAANGKMYGTTQVGGTNNVGVIFEYDYTANLYLKKIDLSPATGSRPRCTLATAPNGKLYGITTEGGANDKGVIFEYDYVSNTYTKRFDFDNSTGSPVGLALSLAPNGKFYGSTIVNSSTSSIFEFDYITGTVTPKVTLSTADGIYLRDPMLLAPNGKFYGVAASGGATGQGVIFEYDYVNNVYNKKVDLTVATGGTPSGKMIYSSADGNLYGILSQGAANSLGGIFRYDYVNNVYTLLNSFTYTGGYSPFNSSLVEVDLSIIPISILEFNARRVGGNALLNWRINQEASISKIEIERSANGNDFNYLANISASSVASSIHNFRFSDTKVLDGKNFYRLKILNSNGNISYSEIRLVNFENLAELFIYPNPVRNEINISFPQSWLHQPAYLSLFDQQGKQVFSKTLDDVKQVEQISLSLKSSGIYLLRLQRFDNTTTWKKIVVVN
ncbi:MAG: T9SS type A sorting domain-containing protein [Bacteroidetes bacterium]|nr:T9SS type A sorting domain-containing protein [Bacteroidota bacterium]